MAEISLQGQVALVTGASRGIGAAIARRLAALGATMALAARDRPALDALAAELAALHFSAHAFSADLRLPGQASGLVAQVLECCGRIDILVNNAGIGHFGKPLHETTLADWQATLDTNLRAPFLTLAAVAPHMIQRRSGHIINISSLAAHNPVPGAAAYAASKWGLNGMTVSAAEELRPFGVRVSLVCPGSVATALMGPDGAGAGKRLDRMLQPDDIAHAVAALVTQAPGSFISEILVRPTLKP